MVINMNIGGTEKALLNMISEIPKEEYDITILMLEKYGGFLNSIPSYVQIKYLDEYANMKKLLNLPSRIMIQECFKKGNLIKAFNLMFFQLITKIMKERSLFFRYLLRKTRVLQHEYDLAVAYAGPIDFISYFVAHKIKAKKKVQWIHFDVKKIGFSYRFANRIYKHFNKIFVVSQEGENIIKNVLPKLKHKIEAFPNITSQDLVLKMADEGSDFNDNFSGIRILTVGRLSKEKGQDITIPVLARLKKDGYNLKWYCIGDGNARSEYENIIHKYELEKDFILLGALPNPYPFMKQCDIYVQPSRHEGYCITLSEAKCFDNPIITTRFTGANEQITHKKNGLIVDFDEDQMYSALKKLLENEALRKSFKKNLRNEKYNTKNNMEKLYNLIS